MNVLGGSDSEKVPAAGQKSGAEVANSHGWNTEETRMGWPSGVPVSKSLNTFSAGPVDFVLRHTAKLSKALAEYSIVLSHCSSETNVTGKVFPPNRHALSFNCPEPDGD